MLTFEPHGWQVGRRSSRPNDFRAKEKQNGKTADTPLTHPSWSHRLTAGWLASRPACLPSDLAIYESAKQIPPCGPQTEPAHRSHSPLGRPTNRLTHTLSASKPAAQPANQQPSEQRSDQGHDRPTNRSTTATLLSFNWATNTPAQASRLALSVRALASIVG